ncbi:hypothetical protein LLEC1_06925 [Akanthomyces lecanii]|uniref:N-acetyltransferase domain-containing protein n=1 Tax=Cordyceps confragosa TaxID=2714763 RepID=A0A179IL31_CORDF|nr:hypothetical protein LLEC1_06925 [Akanthomyces lecanii]
MDAKNPFRSERLEYRGYDPDEHGEFFAAMHKEPLALASSSASILRPVNKKHIEDVRKDLMEKSLLFVIVYRIDPDPGKSQPIGSVSLGSPDADMSHHRCSGLAIDIVREHQGRGYGREALDWTLAWAFEKAGLHRVELEYLGWNQRVRSLYERAGFVEEGRRRQCYFKDGQWWDEVELNIKKKREKEKEKEGKREGKREEGKAKPSLKDAGNHVREKWETTRKLHPSKLSALITKALPIVPLKRAPV